MNNTKANQTKEFEINILPLLKELFKKAWIIILTGLIVGAAVFGITKMTIKPLYRSGFSAYVNNQHAQASKDTLSNADLIAAQQLTKTFSRIFVSNSVLSATLESIGSDLSYKEFSKMVRTETIEETELIYVYVINEDPQLAYELAQAIAKTSPEVIADIVEGSSMKIVDYPEFSNVRYKPNYTKYGLLGFLGGALLVTIILLVLYFRDDTIKNDVDLEMQFSLPILGVIPDLEQIQKSSSGYYGNKYGYEYAHRSDKSEGSDRKEGENEKE